MAQLIVSAKSASHWGKNELAAFNISLVEQDAETFFDGPLAPLSNYTGSLAFAQSEHKPDYDVDSASNRLFNYLDIAVANARESRITLFAQEVLRAMEYDPQDRAIQSGEVLRLHMCGGQVQANPDICIRNAQNKMVCFIQENKTLRWRADKPEAQLAAEAIAAFQTNNSERAKVSLGLLDEQIIPGITMIGTFPRFYKISVTSALDRCIREGSYPTVNTIIYRHTPLVPEDYRDGMTPLANRIHLLRCYQAFKTFVG